MRSTKALYHAFLLLLAAMFVVVSCVFIDMLLHKSEYTHVKGTDIVADIAVVSLASELTSLGIEQAVAARVAMLAVELWQPYTQVEKLGWITVVKRGIGGAVKRATLTTASVTTTFIWNEVDVPGNVVSYVVIISTFGPRGQEEFIVSLLDDGRCEVLPIGP